MRRRPFKSFNRSKKRSIKKRARRITGYGTARGGIRL